jgi:4-alpha-glucanotransferase
MTWRTSPQGAPEKTPGAGVLARKAPLRPARRSGVLLHPTSLPGPHGSGDLGAAAYHFVDWLVSAGQTLWQVLPLGGIGPGNSPYMSSSAFAGNLLLVDLAALQSAGWLSADELAPGPGFDARRVDFKAVGEFRMSRLHLAARRFFADSAATAADSAFAVFCRAQADWLDDYARFMVLSAMHGTDWRHWPAPLRQREPSALAELALGQGAALAFWKFGQWCFAEQWAALRTYANQRDIQIVGDMPIFVANDSVDVWAHPELFDLDAGGRARVVAGVPPDYFSATGQHWGNPLYRWPAHAAEGYAWWIARMRHTQAQVDWVRIDHFRGFIACWEIPASAATAAEGRWVAAPGVELFAALDRALGPLQVIAEDLGVITPEVTALRLAMGMPGMRVLQFAFDGKPRNPYLPYNFEPDTVVYTGTHDNDTTAGWWQVLDPAPRQRVAAYLGAEPGEPHWALIRAAAASVAVFCIVPMQDVLGLDGAARMNVPGEANGAWGWRFGWDQVGPQPAQRLAEITRTYGRSPDAWATADEEGKAVGA